MTSEWRWRSWWCLNPATRQHKKLDDGEETPGIFAKTAPCMCYVLALRPWPGWWHICKLQSSSRYKAIALRLAGVFYLFILCLITKFRYSFRAQEFPNHLIVMRSDWGHNGQRMRWTNISINDTKCWLWPRVRNYTNRDPSIGCLRYPQVADIWDIITPVHALLSRCFFSADIDDTLKWFVSAAVISSSVTSLVSLEQHKT